MTDLIVVAYDDIDRAHAVRQSLVRMDREYLVDLEDAVVVEKTDAGKVKLHQLHRLAAAGAVGGGFWGALIGLLFLNPLLGAAVGAAAGAAGGALSDVGIDDAFMKALGERFQPGSSALFVLVREYTPDKVLDELKAYGGDVLRTSLSHEDEARLRRVLERAGADSGASSAPAAS